MDKQRLARIINSANVEAVAGKRDRDQLLRQFASKAGALQKGEVVLVIVRP